jgi:hypothetical protein
MKKFGLHSCDKPCSPSDFCKGGYCDKNGCYENHRNEAMTPLAEFYEQTRILIKDKLSDQDFQLFIELYQSIAKYRNLIFMDIRKVDLPNGTSEYHCGLGGDITSFKTTNPETIEEIFKDAAQHLINEIMDLQELKIVKAIDEMQTAPEEKINEGINPKSES